MQINMDLVNVARYMQQQNGIRHAVPVWLTTIKNMPAVEDAPLARPIYTFWLMCGGDREMWLRTGITRELLGRIVRGQVNPGLGEVVRLLVAAVDVGKAGEQHAAVFSRVVGMAVGKEANPAQAINALAWQYAVWRAAVVLVEAMVNGEMVGGRDVVGVEDVAADGAFVVGVVRTAVRMAGGRDWEVDTKFPPVWGATVLRAARGMLAGYVATLRKMPRVDLGERAETPMDAEQVARWWLQKAGGEAVGMVGGTAAETEAMMEEAKRMAAGVDPMTGRRGRGRPPGALNRRVAGGGVDAPVDLGE